MNDLRREQFGEFSVLRRPGIGTAQVSVHFAHATGFNAETYRELFAMLDPSIRLYAMDARGHGRSTAVADPKRLRSWRPYREDLEAFVETLRQPLVLAGHSMGATVSLELAAARPNLVKGLVLIDPVIIAPLQIPTIAVARILGLAERGVPIAWRRGPFVQGVERGVELIRSPVPFGGHTGIALRLSERTLRRPRSADRWPRPRSR